MRQLWVSSARSVGRHCQPFMAITHHLECVSIERANSISLGWLTSSLCADTMTPKSPLFQTNHFVIQRQRAKSEKVRSHTCVFSFFTWHLDSCFCWLTFIRYVARTSDFLPWNRPTHCWDWLRCVWPILGPFHKALVWNAKKLSLLGPLTSSKNCFPCHTRSLRTGTSEGSLWRLKQFKMVQSTVKQLFHDEYLLAESSSAFDSEFPSESRLEDGQWINLCLTMQLERDRCVRGDPGPSRIQIVLEVMFLQHDVCGNQEGSGSGSFLVAWQTLFGIEKRLCIQEDRVEATKVLTLSRVRQVNSASSKVVCQQRTRSARHVVCETCRINLMLNDRKLRHWWKSPHKQISFNTTVLRLPEIQVESSLYRLYYGICPQTAFTRDLSSNEPHVKPHA